MKMKKTKKYIQVSEHLVEANLQSVDSHGVVRLTQYTEQVPCALCLGGLCLCSPVDQVNLYVNIWKLIFNIWK